MIIFLLILILAYAAVGYFFINAEFSQELSTGEQENICASIFQCFVNHVYIGLRNGGGIGESLENISYSNGTLYWGRFFYDILYFFFIIIIMLNILFGIVIDSYAELKEISAAKLYNIKNVCFICDAERNDVQKEGIDFEAHTGKLHSFWNYIYYIIGLKFVDEQDLNAVDGYVFELVQEKKIHWLPVYEGKEEEEAEE